MGFHGPDKYDQPGLYGFQYRSIHPISKSSTVRVALNAIQRAMLAPEYDIPRERMRRWLAARGHASWKKALAATRYYRPAWNSLGDHAPRAVKNKLSPRLLEELERLRDNHQEIQMLTHDWSRDPLLFKDRDLRRKVLKEQVRALGRLDEGDSVNAVMRGFLESSGLWEALLRSFGLEQGRFGRIAPAAQPQVFAPR